MSDPSPIAVKETDVFITRTFDAPRATVWRFWTEPARLAEWFGPSAFHVPVDSVTVEPEVGGRWNLSMVDDASGQAFPISGRFTVVEEPEYLEIVLSAQTEVDQLTDVTLRVRFHDHGDRTRMTLHQGPFTAEQREMTAGGWELSFVKLDALVGAVAE